MQIRSEVPVGEFRRSDSVHPIYGPLFMLEYTNIELLFIRSFAPATDMLHISHPGKKRKKGSIT